MLCSIFIKHTWLAGSLHVCMMSMYIACSLGMYKHIKVIPGRVYWFGWLLLLKTLKWYTFLNINKITQGQDLPMLTFDHWIQIRKLFSQRSISTWQTLNSAFSPYFPPHELNLWHFDPLKQCHSIKFFLRMKFYSIKTPLVKSNLILWPSHLYKYTIHWQTFIHCTFASNYGFKLQYSIYLVVMEF